MAYSANWITRVITVPIADMVSLGGNDYELPADDFWRKIRNLEWSFTEGLWAPHILKRANTRTLAGTTYVPENEIVNGYTITMDPLAEKVFLKGDNNNIIDVLNYNGVSVIPSNSGGNTVTVVNGGSGLTALQDAKLDELHARHGLASGRPATQTRSLVTFGDVVLDITGDGKETSTVTRRDA